jgi:hypothetical protein
MPPVDRAPPPSSGNPPPPVLPPSLAADSVLSALYGYWCRQRGSKPFPDRADISPLDLGPRLLPHIGIIELATDDLAKSRVRLVGTALVDELGADLTGKLLSDYASGEYLASLVSLIDDMLRHRAALFSEGGFRWHEERAVMTRRLYLPLSQGGDTPVLMLWGQTFQRPHQVDFHAGSRTVLTG